MQQGNSINLQSILNSNPDLAGQVGFFVQRRSLNHEPVSLGFINGLAIPKGAKHPDISWHFITELMSLEASKQFGLLGGVLSPRSDMAAWARQGQPTMLPFYQTMEYVRGRPNVPATSPSLWTLLGNEVLSAVRGEKPPRTALDQAEVAWNVALRDR